MKRLLLLLALAAPLPAAAHAFLDSATPAVGATVAASPPQLVLRFTESLEPAFCTLAVTDAGGHAVTAAKPVSGAERNQLVLALPPLKPGTYHVTWQAVSVDTHRTNGGFDFTVAP